MINPDELEDVDVAYRDSAAREETGVSRSENKVRFQDQKQLQNKQKSKMGNNFLKLKGRR